MNTEGKFNKIGVPKNSLENPEQLMEDAFVSVVQERIIETMSNALEEVGFTPEEEHAFRESLAALSPQDVSGVLSMPYELRERRFVRLYETMKSGNGKVREIVDTLAREAKERGFTLGYHMSSRDILQRNGGWVIDGKEPDHRDSDLPMAYYSTDLAHLYGRKRARFLYIVRAITGEGTNHRQDNDGAWGRAAKLDIVEKLDYENVIQEVRERVARLNNQAE